MAICGNICAGSTSRWKLLRYGDYTGKAGRILQVRIRRMLREVQCSTQQHRGGIRRRAWDLMHWNGSAAGDFRNRNGTA
jgi:hypothetical protein